MDVFTFTITAGALFDPKGNKRIKIRLREYTLWVLTFVYYTLVTDSEAECIERAGDGPDSNSRPHITQQEIYERACPKQTGLLQIYVYGGWLRYR